MAIIMLGVSIALLLDRCRLRAVQAQQSERQFKRNRTFLLLRIRRPPALCATRAVGGQWAEYRQGG